MESRLNPDAKEFVPSPTHSKQSFEDAIISQSPVGKVLPFDNVEVPSMAQFQQEISQRPGEVSQEDALSNSGYSPDIKSDILNGCNIMDDDVMKKFGDSEFKLTEQNLAAFTSNNPFEVSEVSSTKAVYGDESAASFMTSTSDTLQKNLGTSASNVEVSFTETDFVASETSGVKPSEDFLGFEASSEFTEFKKGLDESLPTDFSPVKESGTISFELQKDIAPTMEECPERVKLSDDLINPFSHEQPITEMPMEECEQLPENEQTNLLNESFEHGPDFTLEAYEVHSPLNPCAPSFDYKNLEDGTDEPKVNEKHENVEAAEQKPSDFPSDLASGITISQTISPESPTELLDTAQKELTELDKDLFPSEHEQALFPEADSKTEEISSFEQVEEYLNKSGQSEKSEKGQFLQYSDEMLNFDQQSVQVGEKSDSVEKSAMLDDKINEKSTDLMAGKEFTDKINEVPSELVNEFHSRSTELVESIGTKHGLHTEQSTLLENRLSLETAETDESKEPAPSAEQIMDIGAFDIHSVPEALRVCVYPMPVEQSNMKDDVELISPSYDSREEKIEPLEEEHIHGAEFAKGVKLESLSGEQRDMMETVLSEVTKKTELEEINDLTSNTSKDVLVSEEQHSHLSYLSVETGSAENTEETAEKTVEKEDLSSVEQTAEKPGAVDMKPVGDEILKLPEVDQPDIENISLTAVEKGESGKEFHITRDEEKTVLQDANNKAEFEKPNGLTSNAGQDEVVILKDHLSNVDIETVSTEKVEETAVEQTAEKLETIKPVNDEILKLPEVDLPDTENVSDRDVEKGESEKEVPKIGDVEEMMLSEVSNKTALEEPKDLTSNAGKHEVLASEDLQFHLNYVGIEAESADKVEETDEKIVEKEDISVVENTAEKPDTVDTKPVSAEALKLPDANISDVKNISDTAVEKTESEQEIHKTADGEEVPTITKTPPPTPTPASQAEIIAARDVSEVKAEEAAAVVAVAAAAVAGITATTAGTTTKKEPTPKKQTPLTKDVKKTPVAKESDKMKPGTKAPVKQSPGTAKVPAKTSPTSPTKLSVPSTPRTSTPKRTPVATPTLASRTSAKTNTTATTAAAKPLSRPASNVANKPTSLTTQKPSSVSGKVTASSTAPKPGLKTALPSTTKPSQTVRAASAPKPRVPGATSTTATKNPLANGDVKSVEVKKTSVTTAKIAPRSHTAPSRTTTVPKTGTASAASVPKTGVAARTSLTSRTGMTNGIGQKPRVTSSTVPSTRPATNHQTATDKQHKETANKHISSRRIGPAPSKTSPAKVGVKKSPQTAKGGKTPPAANGSPLISTGAGDEKKKDPLL